MWLFGILINVTNDTYWARPPNGSMVEFKKELVDGIIYHNGSSRAWNDSLECFLAISARSGFPLSILAAKAELRRLER